MDLTSIAGEKGDSLFVPVDGSGLTPLSMIDATTGATDGTPEQRSGANAYDITYTYDPVGNRLTKTEGGAATTYTYDEANQIQTEQTPSQISTFTFDANGNLQVENAGGQLTTYSWDIENMCVGIALPNGTLNTFAYDGDFARREAGDSSEHVKLVNDLDNVLLETDTTGTTQVAYTLEPTGGVYPFVSLRAGSERREWGNLISQRRSGATAWHLFDALGSTERLTGFDQSAIAEYMHKAFGLTTVLSGSSANRYTWIGRLGYRWEPDARQYDVRRRRLSPDTGRWLNPDPLRIAPDALRSLPREETQCVPGKSVAKMWAGPYAYVRNSPLILVDPAGLQQLCGKWALEFSVPTELPTLYLLLDVSVGICVEPCWLKDRSECTPGHKWRHSVKLCLDLGVHLGAGFKYSVPDVKEIEKLYEIIRFLTGGIPVPPSSCAKCPTHPITVTVECTASIRACLPYFGLCGECSASVTTQVWPGWEFQGFSGGCKYGQKRTLWPTDGIPGGGSELSFTCGGTAHGCVTLGGC